MDNSSHSSKFKSKIDQYLATTGITEQVLETAEKIKSKSKKSHKSKRNKTISESTPSETSSQDTDLGSVETETESSTFCSHPHTKVDRQIQQLVEMES